MYVHVLIFESNLFIVIIFYYDYIRVPTTTTSTVHVVRPTALSVRETFSGIPLKTLTILVPSTHYLEAHLDPGPCINSGLLDLCCFFWGWCSSVHVGVGMLYMYM